MWKSIMDDLKASTLGERVLLGIIAGLFALVGFYVGYEHLSNGVNPWLIGAITALVFMIGCMAASFIIEELLRKIPARKKHEEKRKQPLFDAGSKLPAGEEFEEDKQKEISETPKGIKPSFAKRMTLRPEAKEQEIEKEISTFESENSSTAITKKEPVEPIIPSASSEWDEEITIPSKPIAPIKPKSTKTVEKVSKENNTPATEEQPTPLSLAEFIKANPELSARKMVKEYRLAGGTESTEDILNLMN